MKLNLKSIETRLQRLQQYIAELKKQRKLDFDQFNKDFTMKLAVERAFQAAIECCVDIANHIISVYSLQRPEEQRDVFPILAQAGYLDESYAESMAQMVAFRNRIVHLYWDIKADRLYHYLHHDIPLLEKFKMLTLQILETEEGE